MRREQQQAEEAGVTDEQIDALAAQEFGYGFVSKNSARFAKLVRDAAARECAELCDKQGLAYRENESDCRRTGSFAAALNDMHGALACEGCTAAIRAHFHLDPTKRDT